MFIHGKSCKIFHFKFCGPLPITVYVLEDMSKRSYSTGGQFGMTHVVSSNTQYQTISGMIVHEKQMGAMKTNKAYILMKFLLLQDGTIKVSKNTIISGIIFSRQLKEALRWLIVICKCQLLCICCMFSSTSLKLLCQSLANMIC